MHGWKGNTMTNFKTQERFGVDAHQKLVSLIRVPPFPEASLGVESGQLAALERPGGGTAASKSKRGGPVPPLPGCGEHAKSRSPPPEEAAVVPRGGAAFNVVPHGSAMGARPVQLQRRRRRPARAACAPLLWIGSAGPLT